MKEGRLRLIGAGGLRALTALVVAGTFAVVIATSSSVQSQSAGRMAIVGIALLALALVIGSPRLAGLATLPALGAALFASAHTTDTAWIRSIVLGLLWYVAVELAWDAIAHRDGVARPRALVNRRIEEVTTIVISTIALGMTGLLLAGAAPMRTVFAVGSAVSVIIAGLVWITRRTTLDRSRVPSQRRNEISS